MEINEKASHDFLLYANSVIKSRAISSVEDNLKPVQRRILYTFYRDKLFSTKQFKKCATLSGLVLALHPHGDSSVYNALIKLSQWWKMRYPLIDIHGNNGNILGDPQAASRYTECRLSPIGDLMLEDIDKDCIKWKPNYDETIQEPRTLPSKFPNLLCNGNAGIAVGMSTGILPHNFTEVSEGIKFYMSNPQCSIEDLMKYIKGPDFPDGGQILNGQELLQYYTLGNGIIKMQSHYSIEKQSNGKIKLIFTDIPYGVEVENGIIAPLKKLVVEENNLDILDYNYTTENRRPIIYITLAKNVNLSKTLDLIFIKTQLQQSIKLNNTVIVNGEAKVLSLKELISSFVDYRSKIIQKIAINQLGETNHKLTVALGLQKCLSDIDLLISLIRNANNRNDAKIKIMSAFSLSDEQAEAVLEIKLARLSKLDIIDLEDSIKKYNSQIIDLNETINNIQKRYSIISKQLDEIKQLLPNDKRLTEIIYDNTIHNPQIINTTKKEKDNKQTLILEDYFLTEEDKWTNNKPKFFKNRIKAYSEFDIISYNKLGILNDNKNQILNSYMAAKPNKEFIVFVTKNGIIKLSKIEEFQNLLKANIKCIKLKENDELLYCDFCDRNDTILLCVNDKALRIAISSITPTGKLTQGVKTAFNNIELAIISYSNNDSFLTICNGKAKFIAISDFKIESKNNKGETIIPINTILQKYEDYYCIKKNIITSFKADKFTIKSKQSEGNLINLNGISQII